MMTLHPLGMDMLLEQRMVESFIGLARNAQYNRYLSVSKSYERMLEFRIMINNLSYERQPISDLIIQSCIQNVRFVSEEAKILTAELIQTQKASP